MHNARDLTNQQFERLHVDELAGSIKGKRHWYCTCKCGMEVLVSGGDLTSGKTKSCGCLNRELARKRKLKHGGSINRREKGISKEFQAWLALKGRKADLCDEWKKDFQAFFREVGWAPSPKHRLSRYDERKPFEPYNTFWRGPDDIRDRKELGLATDLGFNIGEFMDAGPAETTGTREETQERPVRSDLEEGDRVTTARQELTNSCR